jgi:hypothetical protein
MSTGKPNIHNQYHVTILVQNPNGKQTLGPTLTFDFPENSTLVPLSIQLPDGLVLTLVGTLEGVCDFDYVYELNQPTQLTPTKVQPRLQFEKYKRSQNMVSAITEIFPSPRKGSEIVMTFIKDKRNVH